MVLVYDVSCENKSVKTILQISDGMESHCSPAHRLLYLMKKF